MDKPTTDSAEVPLYHWAEWPLAALTAALLATALWQGQGPDGQWIVVAFKASSTMLVCWSCYLEWRSGALSRNATGLYQGFRQGEPAFMWLHRRTPFRVVWITLIVLGWWHF